MTDRQLVSSGSPLEPRIGFSRAVRVGRHVMVAGTAPIVPNGATPTGVYAQTVRCLEIVVQAVADAGGSAADIVRTRMMLTDIAEWEEAARAHGAFFAEVRPACTFVGVSAFIDPAWRVEVEADAILPG